MAKPKGKPLVYIASPYRLGNKARNVRRQVDAAHRLMRMGYAAWPPLLNHYIDIVHRHGEGEWLEQDMVLLRRCDALLRLPGESRGADLEVSMAGEWGIPVAHSYAELRRLHGTSRRLPHRQSTPVRAQSNKRPVRVYPKG